MKKLLMAFFVTALLMAVSAQRAQAQNPVEWKTSTEMTSETEGEVILTGIISPGWHIYGMVMPADGPSATQVFYAKTGVDFVGNCKVSPAPKKEYDPMYEAELTFWENKVVFKRAFKITDPNNASIEIGVRYMGCNDSNCIPPRSEQFTVKL